MTKPRVFVTRPLDREALACLEGHCELYFHSEDSALSPARLAEICAQRKMDGLIVAGAQVTEEVLRAAPQLRVVANAGVGYDNIDVVSCTARRIPVTNAAGTLEETTADHAFALLMCVARRVAEGDRFVRDGRWKSWHWRMLWGSDVHHKTLCLYGFGNIGRAMAARARGFAMRVLYHTRRRAGAEVEKASGAEYVDRETLLREADFLSLHVPLTAETRHLMRAADFSRMKRSAYLINTARGPVVDEEALVVALKSGELAGAGLDVFENEPQVHPALLSMANVVLAPHVGSATSETRFRMARVAAENLLAVLEGRRPPNVINPEIYL